MPGSTSRLAIESGAVMRSFRKAATFWRSFARTAFNPYRPEVHYMRGPGPACEKVRARAEAARAKPIS